MELTLVALTSECNFSLNCVKHGHFVHYVRVETRSYSSAASTPLVFGMAANHLPVGDDRLRMPSRSGAVLPGWRVYPHFVRRRQVTAAVDRQWDTRRAAYKDYNRSARLCCVGPNDMEQPPCLTAPVLTFLFTGRDDVITMNSVKNRNHAVMSFLAGHTATPRKFGILSAISLKSEKL